MEKEEKKELLELMEEANVLIAQYTYAEQVIAVRTMKDNIYHFPNYILDSVEHNGNSEKLVVGSTENEDKFIKMLLEKGDGELKHIVCMWNTGGVDVPSMHFRKLLLEASPKNADAKFVVLMEDGNGGTAYGVRTIGWSMPAKYTKGKEE